ncbi:hypothetical protein [Sphingomonas crusticola]|uniref:hypothetical protein n=1 Tax=Sphingomonas crusticola TaxID=1697973 RepID=UPI000E23E71E|nr:hypothetical protein [Sphingomonas crusticola]
MRSRLIIGVAATLGLAGGASAECIVSSDAGAAARPIDMTVQADASIVASMSLLPKLMHLDYAHEAANRPSCDLGSFTAGTSSYALYGEDKAGRVRKAIPAKKGDPIAEIMPVTDMVKMIEASKQGKQAPVEGYLLATLTKTDFTGWRYYSGLPDPAALKRDMAEMLGGGATPIFRNGADGKTAIFVPNK